MVGFPTRLLSRVHTLRVPNSLVACDVILSSWTAQLNQRQQYGDLAQANFGEIVSSLRQAGHLSTESDKSLLLSLLTLLETWSKPATEDNTTKVFWFAVLLVLSASLPTAGRQLLDGMLISLVCILHLNDSFFCATGILKQRAGAYLPQPEPHQVLFDYFLDMETCEWDSWELHVPSPQSGALTTCTIDAVRPLSLTCCIAPHARCYSRAISKSENPSAQRKHSIDAG